MGLPYLCDTVNPSLMEGFWRHLRLNRKMKLITAQAYINIVRKFHNYVGKPFTDVNREDVQSYLTYLVEFEHLKYDSLTRHLAAIRQFFRYILARGEAARNPCDGLHIKRW